MQGLRESQLSTALNDFTPENMLRLVRLAMPNIIRNKLFSEFALETTKDSIKYIRPFFSQTANGHPLSDKAQDYDGRPDQAKPDYDPWGYSKGGEFNGDDFRKALYEDTRDRPNTDLANAIIGYKEGPAYGFDDNSDGKLGADNGIALAFKDLSSILSDERGFMSRKWGANGNYFVDGYTVLYYIPADKVNDKKYLESGKLEQNVIAIQDKGSGQFFAAPGFDVKIKKSPQIRDKFLVTPPKLGPGNKPSGEKWNDLVGTDGTNLSFDSTGIFELEVKLLKTDGSGPAASVADNPAFGGKLLAYGRYNNETDFEGNYLGEVEIKMDEYTFKPSPTSIGVSWSQMTEITLDTSFNISAEETLVTYASQEIRSALDYRAIRIAYMIAKTNGTHNAGYNYEFDAHWDKNQSLEGYVANVETFTNAVDAIGDVMFDEINRGGVSRMVGGPSACSYIKLSKGYSPKGLQSQNGSHQFGEWDGRPLFKVPSAIIPSNQFLCIWKNDAVENDVSIAFGTLIPFFSTGIIQRKNFYKEAGLATYGDWAVLNRRYLALITVRNLKDANDSSVRFQRMTVGQP